MSERICGPYQQGNRFRIVRILNGKQSYESFTTFKAAQKRKDELQGEAVGRTIASAVDDYISHLERFGGPKSKRGLRSSTLVTLRHRLNAILRLERDRPLSTLTPRFATGLYSQRVAEVKPDTHRGELACANSFGAWLVAAGYLRSNPFADVRPEGSLSAGKPRLSTDAARRFLEVATAEGTEESLACVAALILGLRASEVVERTIADLDDRGSVLVIGKAKSKAGERRLRLPPKLRAAIAAHVKGRAAEERIFHLSRYALHYHTVRLCSVAKVPRVTPHGLRGSLAQAEVEVGSSLDRLLPAMGWTSPEVGRRHYLSPGTEQSAAAERRERDLTEG